MDHYVKYLLIKFYSVIALGNSVSSGPEGSFSSFKHQICNFCH